MTNLGDAPASRPHRSLTARIAAARPPWFDWLAGALAWGIAIAAAAWIGYRLSHSLSASHDTILLVLHFIGAAIAWLIALPLIRGLVCDRRAATRFAAALLLLGAGTILLIAFAYAMQYRQFYSRWHAPFGTITWCYQFVFTGAVAAYQFAVLGIRPLLAVGGPLLIASSLWLAHRNR
ncbi:hypothetical protein [Rhizobium halophytocola]|uniref:DUF2306 domain-containing protein n=1 Tax=Rhizobium halophytocola TaxID=735519 RepID=A0ABS4DZH0_9HYPH|nr:hypothetical protein [Rhizobium halophytocola]MBP1851044.1 hypothetical protein [Rhizobium halophytocola]